MMRLFLSLVLIATTSIAWAQKDPGKKVVGRIKVEVYHATDGDPALAGKNASPVDKALVERLQREKQTRFKHYRLLGTDSKDLFRSYENWAGPVKPSDEIMVRFEAQSDPGPDKALLDLELWLGRKKIVKTDIQLTKDTPLWVRGPEWRQGHLIIAVSLLPRKETAKRMLEFENKVVEVHVDADAAEATIDFKFTNTGKEPVFISHIKPACDCTAIKASGGTTLPDKRIRFRPGESGVIRSIFGIGSKKGQLDEEVKVWLTGDPEDKPSIQLTARIHVPQIINMEPRTLKWEVGEKAESKPIEVIMNHEQPIHITQTNSSSSNFSIDLITVEKGKRYTLNITPKSTETPGIGVIQIFTDSPVEMQRSEQIFAMIQRPES